MLMFFLSCICCPADYARPSIELSTTPVEKHAIRLSYAIDASEPAAAMTLYRSYLDLSQMSTLDLNAYPISVITIDAPGARGTFVDSTVADNVSYSYYATASAGTGATATSNVASSGVPGVVIAAAPKQTARIVIDKRYYYLEIRLDGVRAKRYPVCLGRDPVKRKLHQDNSSTPEGIYRMDYIQLQSRFYKALGVSYPNAIDRRRYDEARRGNRLPAWMPAIGGQIQIHGGGIGENWTWGCIALRNEDIDEIIGLKAVKPGIEIDIIGKDVGPEEVERMRRK